MAAWAVDWSAGELAEPEWGAPLLAVVDASGILASWIVTLCRTMRMRVRVAVDATALAVALEGAHPIAVLCADLGGDGRLAGRLLKLVANYDRQMPVLLMTGEDPETLGAVDAAIELWPLTNVHRIAGPVPVDAVLGFLARAGRHTGALRMLAV